MSYQGTTIRPFSRTPSWPRNSHSGRLSPPGKRACEERHGLARRLESSSAAHTSCLMKARRGGEKTLGRRRPGMYHRGMFLKVHAPTKHTDTPSPRPARPDLYNVCRCPRAQCVLPDSLVSRVSQPPALGRLDRRRAHRAQSRGGRAWLWSACIPPFPPRPPSPPAATCCYPCREARIPHVPYVPHGLTAGRALGSSGVDLASHARASHAR